LKKASNLLASEFWSQKRAALLIANTICRSRFTQIFMPGKQRRSKRAAGVARGRLNPNSIENPFSQNFCIGDAIQRHSARETEVLLISLLSHMLCHPIHHFFSDILN